MNNEFNSNENNNQNSDLYSNNNGINNSPMNNEMETLETLDYSNNSSMMDKSLNDNNTSVLNNPVNSNIYMASSQNPVTPEPSYTNPQNINPMPGFESSGIIGTTPPISFEPDQQPKKKRANKTFFVVSIIIILFGIGFGTYYVLQYTDLLNKKPKIEIETKTLEVNMGERLSPNISDYATISGTDTRNCNINLEDVNVKAEGTYFYQVTCGEIIKKGTIKVIDNTDLKVETKNVYKVNGDLINVNEFIKDLNNSYSYEFVDREKVESLVNGTAGSYKIKIKATYGSKSTEVEANLIVLQYKIKGYLTCSSNEQNILDSSAVMTVEEKFAIANDGSNGFGGIEIQKYSFKFTDETKYSNYLAEYKNKGTITVNNITGDVDFDNKKLTIYISNERSKDELDSEYGKDNMLNYRTIRSYFIDTLGYTCSYS